MRLDPECMPPAAASAVTANLFLVGAPRAGTSSLFEYLSRHPDIFGPTEKEPHHFDADVLDGRAPMPAGEYRALYAGASERWRLDASALYLYSADALAAVSAIDGAHAVISLRDPVEQMASWHGLLVATGSEPHASLEDALAAESPDGPFERRYSEIARYAPHVERWLGRLGRDRVHVVVFEQLTGSEGQSVCCGELLAGLGLEATGLGPFPHLNTYRRPAPIRLASSAPLVRVARAVLPQRLRRTLWSKTNAALTPHATRPPISDALRRRLRQELDADVRRLERAIGQDLRALWNV